MRRALREQNRSSAKDLILLAVGHSSIDPSSPSVLISVVNSGCFSENNFWWVVLNTSSTDITAETTRQVKGKDKFKEVSDVAYGAGLIGVRWDEAEKEEKTGVKTQVVKIAKFGAMKQKYLANPNNGCA